MASVERLVQTWMASGRTEEIDETAAAISSDQIALLSVVKALGEYLTSEESELRQKGVEFLSLVLAKIPREKQNRQTVRVLTNFYCSKLDDSDTIKPALNGLVTLVSSPSFSPAEATAVVEAILTHVKMKALVQSTRFIVFSIIDSLMANHRNALKSMGKIFLDGYVTLTEGEKDPRNLMVAFAIARVILLEFDISEHYEALFNVTFCYFPITFRPPPNDPYGITTDDLRVALRKCLNATPLFGQLSIPVFLEKLAAGSRATKKDTLETMAACLPVYGAALARTSARKLWNSLKLEIFQPMDSITEEEALRTTQVLVKTIYSEEEAALEANEDIQGLARDACKECIDILKEPEKSQAKPATKILCSFISTTPSVSRYTISQAVPHLVKLFLDPDEATSRGATLMLLSEFIEAARQSAENPPGPSPVTDYKDEVLGVFTVGLKNDSTRLPGLAGLKAMVLSKDLLSDDEVRFVVHNVNEIVEGSPEEFDDASEEILGLLVTISEISPRHVAEQTLPLLFRSLPDAAPTRDDAVARGKAWKVLSALETLCVQPDLFENLVIRLITKLEFLCSPGEKYSPSEDLEPVVAYAHALLKTIAQTLSAKVEKKHVDVAKYLDGLVAKLYNLFISSAFNTNQQVMVCAESRLIGVAAEIITLVTRSLPESRQKTLASNLVKALLEGDVQNIAQGFHKIGKDQKLSIFGEGSTTAIRNTLPLFSAVVIALRKQVCLPLPNTSNFLDMLVKWILEVADDDLQKLAALHMLAAIINRQAEELSSFFQDKLDNFWYQKIASSESALVQRTWAIKIWSWISKALVVRKHLLSFQFTERLYETFGDADINWEGAKALGEIPYRDSVVTKANHAEVKVLYAQKYANVVLPYIIKSASDSSNPTKQTASLVAVTSVIQALPRATYAREMSSLIPLLLRGLELPDPDVRSGVIETLLAAATGETPEKSLVAEHAGSLVQSMLKNSKVTEMPSVKVRIVALKYLAILPSIVRYDILHPQRSKVLRELVVALDDPKRTVRREAVVARTNWFKYKG